MVVAKEADEDVNYKEGSRLPAKAGSHLGPWVLGCEMCISLSPSLGPCGRATVSSCRRGSCFLTREGIPEERPAGCGSWRGFWANAPNTYSRGQRSYGAMLALG